MPRMLRSWAVCLCALALLSPREAAAQDYPAKPITFIVAFAAGGVADGIGRMIAQKLGETFKQTIVVENRGGAGGNLAARQVASAAPDGTTILVTTTALAINETLHRNKGFAASDLETVAIVASSPEAFAVGKTSPATSLADVLAAAKGKTINFGSAGIGSGSHIAAEYFFKETAKVPATHVQSQGGAPRSMPRRQSHRPALDHVAPALRNRALHHDVPVENAAHSIRDRFVVIVTIDQHREEPRNRTCSSRDRARALQ